MTKVFLQQVLALCSTLFIKIKHGGEHGFVEFGIGRIARARSAIKS